MKHVCVVFGGNGKEREVSISSASSIVSTLKHLNYKVSELDFNENFINDITKINPDVVFNAMHGTWGEDGTLPTILNFLKIPYTHSGRKASIIAMNKEFIKQIAKSLNIKINPSYIYTKEQILTNNFKKFEKTFIKPCSEGSTVGCVRLFEKELSSEQKNIISSVEDNFFLVEEFFEGVEVSIAVFKNKAIGGVEIAPKNGYYDYFSKYTKGQTEYFIPPRISSTMLQELQEVALKIHNTIEAKDVSRSDFLIKNEEYRFLEINTHPGFTATSLVPKIATYNKISFAEILKSLIEKANFEPYNKL